MQQPAITISIVTYRTPPTILSNCLQCVARITVPLICYVVDNSKDRQIQAVVESEHTRLSTIGRLMYLPNENTGYGAANNRAIRKAMDTNNCPFHLVMNPDIVFAEGMVESMLEHMYRDESIGLLSPRIVFPDGRLQRLCKLLPTPGHLFFRRFLPMAAKKRDAVYQLEFADDRLPFDCPNLSGCFMLLRMKALQTAGLFDERFFLYFEDVDLVRRIGQSFRTVYWPAAEVVHGYVKASYADSAILFHHVISSVRYFHKWGWFVDRARRKINRQILRQVPRKRSDSPN